MTPEEKRAKARARWTRYREKNRAKCNERSREYAARRRTENPEGMRECMAKWRAENREKVRECMAKWRAENREKVQAYKRKRYAENREKERERDAKRYAENPEKVRERVAKYRVENREKLRKYMAKYRVENPEKVCALAHRRRARKGAVPGKYTTADVRAKLAKQGGLCFYCDQPLVLRGPGKYHVEHMAPLARPELNPTNGPENIVCACPTCNLRKHTMHAIEFLALLARGRAA